MAAELCDALGAMNKRSVLGLGFGFLGLALVQVWSACSPVVRTIGGSGGQSSNTGGGNGGTGGVTDCSPGQEVPCYEGPAETKDVGECKSGTAMCGEDGKPGACTGQVLPVSPPADCSLHLDQDCDGKADRCALDFIWGKAYGVAGGGGFALPALDIDPMGNVIYAGSFNGQLDFGVATFASASGDSDGFIAKIDPSGQTIWARKFGDPTNDQEATAVRADKQGNVIVAGSYYGTLDGLGIQVDPSAGSSDVFVAKLDPMGNALWARWGGDSSYQSIESMALAPNGDVIVVGRFSGTWAFNGGGPTFSDVNNNGNVMFVQRFDANGNPLWGTALSNDPQYGYGSQYVYSVAVDINGDILVTGYFEGGLKIPDGSVYVGAGYYDVFAMKLLGSNGQVLWTRTYGGPEDEQGFGLATDSQGSIYLSGRFDTSFTIGSETVTPQDGQQSGMYLAKLSPGGDLTWLKGFGCGTDSGGMFVEVSTNNTLLLVGAFDGTVDFGGGQLSANVTAGSFAAAGFLAKLDSNGNHIGSRVFQPPPPVDPNSTDPRLVVTYRVGTTPTTHEIVVGGLAFGQLDLGGGLIGLEKAAGPFLGKYAP